MSTYLDRRLPRDGSLTEPCAPPAPELERRRLACRVRSGKSRSGHAFDYTPARGMTSMEGAVDRVGENSRLGLGEDAETHYNAPARRAPDDLRAGRSAVSMAREST